MITSLFLQCSKYKYLDLVTCVVSKKKPLSTRETRESGREKHAWQISHLVFSSVRLKKLVLLVMVMADRCDVEAIIKLGGSAVTQKDTFETVKHDAILAAAKLVKQINGKCIVIHGAG